MANPWLVGSIGNGVGAAAQGFFQARQDQEDRQRKNTMLALEARRNGMQYNQDTGDLSPTALGAAEDETALTATQQKKAGLLRDAQEQNDLRTPDSPQSKARGLLAQRYGKLTGVGDLSGGVPMSAHDYDSVLASPGAKDITGLSETKMKSDAAMGAATTRANKGPTEQFIEGARGKYAANLEKSGIPDALTTINQIEDALGAPVEELKGKNTEIPGYGRVAGLKPDFMLDDKSAKVRQLVQRLSNVQLKQRSGAAVTNQEMDRFKKEFGTGTFVSQERLLDALSNYKAVLGNELQNWGAGTPEEARSRYENAGGISAKDIKSAKGLVPKGLVQQKATQTMEHPDDNEAVAWAKANPGNPKAAAILKLNGVQ